MKDKNFWALLWEGLFKGIQNYLSPSNIARLFKDKVIKAAVKNFSKYLFGQAWLVTFITKELWDEIVVPVLNESLVEIDYIKNKIEGNISAEKIIEARKYENMDEYHNAVDDLFGRDKLPIKSS